MELQYLEDKAEVGDLLLKWQHEADSQSLSTLCGVVMPVIERAARSALARMNIRDSGAVDDTLSLVLDHLRRLPICDGSVGTFETRPTKGDAGIAYLRWLTRRRAMDVARAIQRRRRHEAAHAEAIPQETFWIPEDCDEPDFSSWLHSAIATLDARSQEVIGFLLKGLSQAEIAKELGVCEGTVSRIRAKAINQLRWLASQASEEFDGWWKCPSA